MTLASALRSYLALGLGRDLAGDTLISRRAPPSLVEALRRNASPRGAGTELFSLQDTLFWPEGITYDPRSRSYLIASVRRRTIAQVSENGAVRLLFPADQRDIGAVMGLRIDTVRNVLWATVSGIPQMEGYQPADSAIAALLEIRVSDGAILRRCNIAPAAGGHVLGDLAIGPHGDVFITDSNQPVLYRLRPGADSLERITHPLFHSLQGLAPSSDGRVLYISDYSHGLIRIDLATNEMVRVAEPSGTTLLGIDGMAWYRGDIVAVQNGVQPARVVRLRLDASGRNVTSFETLALGASIAASPAIGTVVGNMFVYVANSLWDDFDDNGHQLPSAHPQPSRIMRIPLSP